MSGVDDFTWLTHPDTGGTWRCPDPAVEAWLARGWQLGEEPPEPDTTKDPEPEPAPAAMQAPEPIADEPTEDAATAPEPEEN